MQEKTIGLDLAKDVFQVHGVSVTGDKVFNKKIKRAKRLEFFKGLPPCVVGLEACGSAHHWGRELRNLGRDLRLIPAAYVKPYVKRGKTDAVDAEAICEAVGRSAMRCVETKTEDQQALLTAHRTRERIVRQRTLASNMIRGMLRESGCVLPTGVEAVVRFSKCHLEGDQLKIPELANEVLGTLCYQPLGLSARIEGVSKSIESQARRDANARKTV